MTIKFNTPVACRECGYQSVHGIEIICPRCLRRGDLRSLLTRDEMLAAADRQEAGGYKAAAKQWRRVAATMLEAQL